MLNLNRLVQFGYLFDGEGADPGTSTGAVPDTAATPAPATSGASASPAIGANPQATATSGVPEGFVPSYRIRETREAAIRQANESFAAREAEYRSQLERVQSQIRALTGVTPPPNPEVESVRQQFAQLFPNLAALEEKGVDILSLLDKSGDIEQQNAHYWQNYGRQTMDRLFKHAEDALGAPLTEQGRRQLHSSFVGFVQSSPELTERYAQDPTIVEDFWRDFTSSFIDPVRRTSVGATAARVAGTPTPQDKAGASAPPVTAGPQPKDLDERSQLAWARYQQLQNKG